MISAGVGEKPRCGKAVGGYGDEGDVTTGIGGMARTLEVGMDGYPLALTGD